MADINSIDSDDENFEDAYENFPIPTHFDLVDAIDEITIALHLFLNNKFSESEARMKPFADRSLYHALGYGTILFFQAMMTFDPRDIEMAMDALKNAVIVCNKHRRYISVTDSLSKMVRRPNYDSYSDVEVHAELCYAESLLLRAVLTFIQDENLISFVKGGLKIRSCYQSYKECVQILKHRTWKDNFVRSHFESGVLMGVGAFNLLISSLPAKILKLLEFIGFSGNRTIGLAELDKGQKLKPGLRGPLSALILILYHTMITYFTGMGDGDLVYTASILNPLLQLYPKGVLFLFFAGRLQEIQGKMDEAIDWLQRAVSSQEEWKQLHHLSYWELMWCHCFKCEWRQAAKYAGYLVNDSRWSKATYSYQKGSFLCMLNGELSPEERNEMNKAMNDVPNLKQRIAGKSIPIEKFAVKKNERFMRQQGHLVLPALELVYVWNGFTIMGKDTRLVHQMYDLIERTLQDLEKDRETDPFYMDNYCLALILKGMCLKYMNSPLQADSCFREVWQSEKKLKDDLYLAPFALVELGLLCLDNDQITEAVECLELARNNYKGYSLESRLHFKVHSGMAQIKAKTRQLTADTSLALGNTPRNSPKTSPVHTPIHIVPPKNIVSEHSNNKISNGIYYSETETFNTRL